MYRNLPTPTPRLLDCEARIVQPTLVKEFIRAVGPTAPRQHGDRINGESKVILASPQGILRHQLIPKQSYFHGGVHRLFQLGFHSAVLNWPLFTSSTGIISRINCPFTSGTPYLVMKGSSRPCAQANNPRTPAEFLPGCSSANDLPFRIQS